MKNSPSSEGIDQTINVLAVILVAGTLLLPFAKGAIIGTGRPAASMNPESLAGGAYQLILPQNFGCQPVMPDVGTFFIYSPGSSPCLLMSSGICTNLPERFEIHRPEPVIHETERLVD